jgi:HD-GYP domain-containing protein (c-di-GMP phosphodiesterase class II)
MFSTAGKGLGVVAAGLVGIPVALFVGLRIAPGLDLLYESVNFHLIVVGGIAACAAGVAIFAAFAAGRSQDPSLVVLALGCLFLAAGMLGHGLTTPGVAGMPMNMWVIRFPTLAIAGFAACQVGALLDPRRSFLQAAARHPWLSLGLPAAALGGLLIAVVAAPEAGIGSHPVAGEEAITNALRIATVVALLDAAIIHWKRWRLGGDRIQLALVLASLLAAEAELSLHFGRLWRLSWWDYHALLFVGFGITVYVIVAGYVKATGKNALGSVYSRDDLEHIARGYPEALTALVAATEARDRHTYGHSRRVAELSFRIGQQMNLSSDALRRLVWGAELHDIGKIGIPDYILNKEGPLTADECVLVEQHPAIGWDIARRTRSLGEVLDVVRHHHERIDGAGYPDGLAGDEISLAARIVAVADVWDALTSDRSYRPAWSHDAALGIMREGSGTQFAPECVDALVTVVNPVIHGAFRRAPTLEPRAESAG